MSVIWHRLRFKGGAGTSPGTWSPVSLPVLRYSVFIEFLLRCVGIEPAGPQRDTKLHGCPCGCDV